MDKLPKEVLEKTAYLIEKYHLVENRGETSIIVLGTTLIFKNFVIKEIMEKLAPIYIAMRGTLQHLMRDMDNYEGKDVVEPFIKLSDAFFALLFLCINVEKSQLDIFIRKFTNLMKDEMFDSKSGNKDIFESFQIFVDLICTCDYIFYRGIELSMLMMKTIESGDLEQIKNLPKIVPYDIITANSKEELEYKLKQKGEKEEIKKQEQQYDLSTMNIIGEA